MVPLRAAALGVLLLSSCGRPARPPAPPLPVPAVAPSAPIPDRIEPRLRAIREKYRLPALAVLGLQDGHIRSYIEGVRKWGDPTPAGIDDPFFLASCTKAMTATLVALFVERGLLRWDETLAELFPGLGAGMNAQLGPVTLEMVMAHRAGLPRDPRISPDEEPALAAAMGRAGRDGRRLREVVARAVLTSAPDSRPGSRYAYSNTDYVLAGAILERVSGRSWEDLMQGEIFAPLDMKSCGFGWRQDPREPHPSRPWGHSQAGADPRPASAGLLEKSPFMGPAGGVHCSLPDWAKFVRVHLDGFNGKGTALLKSESFRRIHQSYPGQSYTPGAWVREPRDWAGGDVLQHAGNDNLNYAVVWIAPHRNAAFLGATNEGGPDASRATGEAIDALIEGTLSGSP